MEFGERWSRLVELVIEGRIVPFVGSGLSRDARSPFAKGRMLDVGFLERRLKLALRRPGHPEPDDVDRIRNGWKWSKQRESFSKLAELVEWRLGRERMVRAIRPQWFATLEPTPAHGYIVALAREGCIPLVFTTNWDCCFERAWNLSFPSHERASEHARAAVAFDPRSYREHGYPGAKGRGRRLSVRKLNGCAGEFVDAGSRLSAAEKATLMRLTDRDLQHFWDQDWARSMIENAVQSRELVFSGFGSDEPQVQHTMTRLARGMGDSEAKRGQGDSGSPADPKVTPGFPWIHVFEEHPTFAQAQLLHAFDRGLTLAAQYRPPQTVFSGSDSERFARQWYFRVLPGDTFWCRLHQAVLRQRLRTWLLADDCPLDTWVDDAAGRPPSRGASVAVSIAKCLLPEVKSVESHQSFGRLRAMWLAHHARPAHFAPAPLRLSALLLALSRRWPDVEPADLPMCSEIAGVYIPFAEEPELYGKLLLAVWLAHRASGRRVERIARDLIATPWLGIVHLPPASSPNEPALAFRVEAEDLPATITRTPGANVGSLTALCVLPERGRDGWRARFLMLESPMQQPAAPEGTVKDAVVQRVIRFDVGRLLTAVTEPGFVGDEGFVGRFVAKQGRTEAEHDDVPKNWEKIA